MNRDEWYDKHKHCPKCGNWKTQQTLIGVVEVLGKDFEDNWNDAECLFCEWKGKVKDLV